MELNTHSELSMKAGKMKEFEALRKKAYSKKFKEVLYFSEQQYKTRKAVLNQKV